LFRHYPQGESASHVIGYIGRISQKDAEALEESKTVPITTAPITSVKRVWKKLRSHAAW
jgi:cell division protein FtsI/penicillin-binding protein 2